MGTKKTPKKVKAPVKSPAQAEQKKRQRILNLIERFAQTYPDAKCSLNFKTAYELLVATILSAQCTDERVNIVTPAVFAKYPDARAMAKAKLQDVEKLVQSTGFYKNKALSLIESAKAIVAQHGGDVPSTLEALVKLRGVGRKTANVVLGNVYGVPGIVVDTHVGRLSLRLGLTSEKDPVKVEQDLMKLVPQDHWVQFCHELIYHGRARCVARKPDCLHCEVRDLCPRVGVTDSTETARPPSVVSGKVLRARR